MYLYHFSLSPQSCKIFKTLFSVSPLIIFVISNSILDLLLLSHSGSFSFWTCKAMILTFPHCPLPLFLLNPFPNLSQSNFTFTLLRWILFRFLFFIHKIASCYLSVDGFQWILKNFKMMCLSLSLHILIVLSNQCILLFWKQGCFCSRKFSCIVPLIIFCLPITLFSLSVNSINQIIKHIRLIFYASWPFLTYLILLFLILCFREVKCV